jgi:DNA sulfur modification protein DndB
MAGHQFECLNGMSAGRPVILGFAPANVLVELSFADVLNEETGRGYQRRFNAQHSLDFRRYIQQTGSSTIPLTLNLRPDKRIAWRLRESDGRAIMLDVNEDAGKVFAQVDCQHRLGHLGDTTIELPFMSFIGLTEREEMEVFNTINSKAKGLSASLLDFHDAQLCSDLAADRPELFIALYLRNEPQSPWFGQLDLGGDGNTGLTRRASLRTIQKAVKRFLVKSQIERAYRTEAIARVVMNFWIAVSDVFHHEWTHPRKFLITKGIGVYCLMDLAADLYREAPTRCRLDRSYFSARLSDFANELEWSSEGPLKGLGGEGGVAAATDILRACRLKSTLKVAANG